MLVSVANCAHGFPQGECLICQTLGGSQAKPTATKTKVGNSPEAMVRDVKRPDFPGAGAS